MALQQRVSLAKKRKIIGTMLEVMVDDYGDEPGEIKGRSKGDAPGIDGSVIARSDGTVKIGDIVEVSVTEADPYDLYGDVVGLVR
jgi:ribosomal protein S12 methylthiotransferase